MCSCVDVLHFYFTLYNLVYCSNCSDSQVIYSCGYRTVFFIRCLLVVHNRDELIYHLYGVYWAQGQPE